MPPVHIGRIDGVSANNAKLGLQSLRYVDARESTGGLRLDIYSNSSRMWRCMAVLLLMWFLPEAKLRETTS